MRMAIVAACVLGFAGQGWAWGPDGHRIIAEIAEQRLSEEARAAVADLLGGQTMAEVSTWADQVRSHEGYAWSAPLHYANLASGATRFDMERDCGGEPAKREGAKAIEEAEAGTADEAPVAAAKGCVVSAIETYRGVLEDENATREQKAEALKFLIHFVGDVHQPLHVSFARDRGGNDVKVTFLGRETNLHRVWDTGLIGTRGLPWPVYMEALSGRITVDQRAAWAETDPGVWATESYQLAVSNAYATPADGALDEDYVSRNIGIVETRLSQAGVRLAVVLNEVFAGEQGEEAPQAEPQEAPAEEVGPAP